VAAIVFTAIVIQSVR